MTRSTPSIKDSTYSELWKQVIALFGKQINVTGIEILVSRRNLPVDAQTTGRTSNRKASIRCDKFWGKGPRLDVGCGS